MYEVLKANGKTVSFPTFAGMIDALNNRNAEGEHQGTPKSVTHNGSALPIVVNEYRRVGVQLPGTAREVLDRLIAEVVPYVFPNAAPGAVTDPKDALQPWQMTKAEWNAVSEVGSIAYGVTPCLTAEQMSESFGISESAGFRFPRSVTDHLSAEFLRLFGYGHNGPTIGPRENRISNSRHDVHMEFALEEGKPVPARVLADYYPLPERRSTDGYDSPLRALLEKPFLRGRFMLGRLHPALSAMTNPRVELTEENVAVVADIANKCVEPIWSSIDNALYAAEIIPARVPAPIAPAVRPDGATDQVARLRSCIITLQKDTAIKALETQKNKGNITQRDVDRELAVISTIPATADWHRPMRITEMLNDPKTHIDWLLANLDRPDDAHNVATKRFAAAEFGLTLLYKKAEDRRTAIFEFAGFSPVERQQWEAAETARLAEREVARQDADAIDNAEKSNVQLGAVVCTWKEAIDGWIADGFTQVKTIERKTYIVNPTDGRAWNIKKSSSAYPYALVATRKAAEARALAAKETPATSEAEGDTDPDDEADVEACGERMTG